MWCMDHEDDADVEEDVAMAMSLISSSSAQRSSSTSPAPSTSSTSEEERAMDEGSPVDDAAVGGSVVQQVTLEEVMKELLSDRKADW